LRFLGYKRSTRP